MRYVNAVLLLFVFILFFSVNSMVVAQVPGFGDLNQYDDGYNANQQQASSAYGNQSVSGNQSDLFVNPNGYDKGSIKGGSWDRMPSSLVFPGGQQDFYDQSGQFNDYGQSGQLSDYGQSGQFNDYGQSGQFNDYGQSGQFSGNGDEMSQMSQQNFYEDENRDWLPTFGEFWNLAPEQRRDYSKKIKAHIKVLLSELKSQHKQKTNWYKNQFRQLNDHGKKLKRDLSNQKKQLSSQIRKEQSRMKEEERRILSQLKEEERRVKAQKYNMSKIQIAEAVEEIRLRREQTKMDMRSQIEQLNERVAEQQMQMEEQELNVAQEIDNRINELQLQELASKARYRLATLSLKGSLYRDRVPRPEFGNGSVVSEKEREFKKKQYDAWKDQRVQEERRMKELSGVNKAQRSLWKKVKARREKNHLKFQSRLARLRAKSAAAKLQRDGRSKNNQLKLHKYKLSGQRRVQDLKLSYTLSELRKAGHKVNREALKRYKSQISERRKQENYEIKEAENRLRYEEKELRAQLSANEKELLNQLKEQSDALTQASRNEAEQMEAQDDANRDRMKAWVISRRDEEKATKHALDNWLRFQKTAYKQWRSSHRDIGSRREQFTSGW